MTAQPASTQTASPRERLIAACDTDAVPAEVRRTILRMRVTRAARSGFEAYRARKGL